MSLHDFNEMSRRVTVEHYLAELVEDQRKRVRTVDDFGSGDAARLALLMKDAGDCSDAFLFGGPVFDLVARVAADAKEWLEQMSREASR